MNEIMSLKPQLETVIHHSRKYDFLIANERISRPFRREFCIFNAVSFEMNLRTSFDGSWHETKSKPLEMFVYTALQVIGCYLDIFAPTAPVKTIGTVFECLIACALRRACSMKISSGNFPIPGRRESIRTDLCIWNNEKRALFIATKTSTRERLSQPFIQKYIVDQISPDPIKSIMIVIGDVQRIGRNRVQHTFTAGQFLLYWDYLTKMDGVYYIDIPPQVESFELKDKIKSLNMLFSEDLSHLLGK